MTTKGRKLSEEHKQKIREALKGPNHYLWQGNKVNYRGLHLWVQRELCKAKKCEHCGKDSVPKNRKRHFNWANISRKYKRNLKDWISLCIPCHIKYDYPLGKPIWNKGKKLTEKHKKSLSKAHIGKVHTVKTKRKISRSMKLIRSKQ